MRGAVILMASADSNCDIGSRDFKCVALDWYARKHTHVVRSTFAAELHTLLDALGQGVLLNLTLTEIHNPGLSPKQLAQIQDQGSLWPEMDGFIDARAVFDAITADPVKQPTEKQLSIHLKAARDLIDTDLLRRLFWIDTLDMLADGLTKGSVDRAALIRAGYDNIWRISGMKPAVFMKPSGKNLKIEAVAKSSN